MTPDELLQGCIAGDDRAWAELIRQYGRLIRYLLRETLAPYGLARSEQDIDDLVGDFFAGLLADDRRLLRGIRESGSLKSYLAVAARRRAIDFLRARRNAPLSLDGMRPDDSAVLGAGQQALAIAAKERESREDDRAPVVPSEAVARILATLPEKERDLVCYCYLENLSHRDAAVRAGVAVNSVGPMLYRALQKLQRGLTEMGLTAGD